MTFVFVVFLDGGQMRSALANWRRLGCCLASFVFTSMLSAANAFATDSQPVFKDPSATQTIVQPSGTGVFANRFANIRFADQFTSIQAAINDLPSSGGVVYLKAGSTSVASTITIAKPVTLIGHGFSAEMNNQYDAPWAPASELSWTGGSSPVIQINGPVAGVRLMGFGIAGGGVATIGISADAMQSSVIRDVGVQNVTDVGLRMYTSSTTADVGTQHNLIEQFSSSTIYGNVTTGIIRLEGNEVASVNPPTANSCHNTFSRVWGIFSVASGQTGSGIKIYDGDNNTFIGVYTFKIGAGTGYGAEMGYYARSNYFFHFQGSVIARTPYSSGFVNTIFGYDRANGAASPVRESGAQMTWTEDGENSSGWYIGRYLQFGNDNTSEFAVVKARTAAGGLNRLQLDSDFVRIGTSVSNPDVEVRGGNLGIGVSSPSVKLQVAGDTRVGTSGSNGCVQNYGGGALVGSCSSDRRLKTDVRPLMRSLERLVKLRPVSFKWRKDASSTIRRHDQENWGLVADEVEAVLPELVGVDDEGLKTVRYGPELQMLLIRALAEQQEEIQALRRDVRRVRALNPKR